jgi:hypothetical protein
MDNNDITLNITIKLSFTSFTLLDTMTDFLCINSILYKRYVHSLSINDVVLILINVLD